MSDKSNGHGKYQPDVYYEYLDADVWYRVSEDNVTIIYTEEILAELYGDDDLEQPRPDSSN